MVREEGADDLRAGNGFWLCGIRHAGARPVVDRFVEPESPVEALAGQPLEVLRGRRRIDEAGQCGGVRGDHQVVDQPASQSKAGHTERAVLVVARAIGECIGGFRDAPGHTAPARVLDLPPDATRQL